MLGKSCICTNPVISRLYSTEEEESDRFIIKSVPTTPGSNNRTQKKRQNLFKKHDK